MTFGSTSKSHPGIMADVAYRSSSSEGGGSFSSAKRGTMGALPQMAFNYDVIRSTFASMPCRIAAGQLHAHELKAHLTGVLQPVHANASMASGYGPPTEMID